MSTIISVIPGVGIGREIMTATLRVLDALDAGLEYEFVEAGLAALENTGELIPQETLDSITNRRVLLKGPLTTPVGKGFRSINVTLRKQFDL
ncbi:MAG: NAD-dependent isocitrate dehydrogenase, partial [Xanthomonadales bacterium]|nr:NAD-dependent isocitrate dehydrogenase [Xanthomonadales bacterium]